METERKYLGVAFSKLRAPIEKFCAPRLSRHLETNIILDNDSQSLRKAGSLLRLRRQKWPWEERFWLTYKYVSRESRLAEEEGVKAREEIELYIPDGPAMLAVFNGLGYNQAFFYEKFREAWDIYVLPGDCVVDLDILPFGEFVEIEGEPDEIDRAQKLLGLDKYEISLKNYYELNREWRAANNLPEGGDILFDAAEKDRIFKSIASQLA